MGLQPLRVPLHRAHALHPPRKAVPRPGRSARYRYYTCYSRQRYGPERCDADRLPADQLAQVDAEINRSEDAVERYLLAFEAGTMPEALCGERLPTLAPTGADLRCRKGELTAQLDDEPTDTYDDLDSTELQDLVDGILTHDDENDLPATKALFQQLIETIEVDGRHAVRPTFRVASFVPAVRNVSGLVETMGLEPTTPCLQSRCSSQLSYVPRADNSYWVQTL